MFESHLKPPISFPTLTGSIVTFNSQYAGLPLKSHKIALTATQSGSGTPSPDNVRTINGYSAINIANASEDLYHDITIENGYLDIYGNVQASGVSSVTDYIPVVEGLVYYYFDYATASLGPRNICIYDDSKQFVSYIAYETVNKKAYVIIPSTGAYIRITIDRNYTNQHLYNGTTTTIQIGSTVYGGEYDARTGVLMANVKTRVFNGADSEDWGDYPNGNGYSFSSIADMQSIVLYDGLCNWLKVRTTIDNTDTNAIYIGVGNRNIYAVGVKDIAPTLADWRTYLSNNNLIITYPLATPTTIQLPPCPIDTLQGVNNIWADTGNTTLQYIKLG